MHPRLVLTLADVVAALDPRFRILNELRAGGQAIVYAADRSSTPDGQACSDRIALKVYFDPDQDQRVIREIQALEGYRHPNMANLLKHGVITIGAQRVRYVVWEYVEGEPLDQRIARGALPAKTVACAIRDVSRAIAHIWAKRIVHRDINPKNIMLRTGDQEAVLLDLGVARYLDRTILTAAGVTWGTLGYFSPEQARGEPLTCHSDVFSLGLTAQELLFGDHPTGRDQRHIPAGLRRTGTVLATVPAPLANLIDSMLNARAAFRPAPSALAEECANLVKQL